MFSILQGYLDAAEQEREKYLQEMAAYKQTEAYKQFNEHKQKKKVKTANITDDVSIYESRMLNTKTFYSIIYSLLKFQRFRKRKKKTFLFLIFLSSRRNF